jgi:hypothetical protein
LTIPQCLSCVAGACHHNDTGTRRATSACFECSKIKRKCEWPETAKGKGKGRAGPDPEGPEGTVAAEKSGSLAFQAELLKCLGGVEDHAQSVVLEIGRMARKITTAIDRNTAELTFRNRIELARLQQEPAAFAGYEVMRLEDEAEDARREAEAAKATKLAEERKKKKKATSETMEE